MTMRALALALGMVALAAVGCARAAGAEDAAEKPELTPELRALVLDAAPTDIPHPLYVDFNARAELLGYALEPQAMAAPGSKLSLKLYWRATGELPEGYAPFTELVTPDDRRIEVAGNGPVRRGPLTPSHWERGKVYVDELDVTVPADIDAARFAIVVGFKTQPSARKRRPSPRRKEARQGRQEAEDAEGSLAQLLNVLSAPPTASTEPC